MENFKFALSSLFIIALLGGAGYWAFSTMESGSTHVDIQKQKELQSKNIELEKQIVDLTRQVDLLRGEKENNIKKDIDATEDQKDIDTPAPVTTPKTTTPVAPKTTTLKYQTLINELQKLVDGNIFLKYKSQGTAVGSIQKFFNIYNNTSNKVDNDFGLGTVTIVKNFQKSQGLTADGEVGPSTIKKMISWLKTK